MAQLRAAEEPGLPDTVVELGDLWKIERAQSTFGGEAAVGSWQWHALPPGALQCPRNRAGHSAVMIDERTMRIFGGFSGHDFLSDVVDFDLGTGEWVAVEPGGICPVGRRGHSAVFLNGRMYVYGGLSRSGPLAELLYLEPNDPECNDGTDPGWSWRMAIMSPYTDGTSVRMPYTDCCSDCASASVQCVVTV